jgi:hypothetical protein
MGLGEHPAMTLNFTEIDIMDEKEVELNIWDGPYDPADSHVYIHL